MFRKENIILEIQKKQISASLEDYLETIYEIVEEKHGVKAIDVSRKLGVGRAAVTEALKTLAVKKLVNYGRYEVLSLTKEGEKIAKRVALKHSVLSEFFVDFLGLPVDEAQENACKIEHVISDLALERFIAFIGHHKSSKVCNGCLTDFLENENRIV